jgi:hypothetical protein
VRLCDIGDQYVSCPGWESGAVFPKKLSDPFNDDNAQLAFNVMGMNGKYLAGPEIEIEDFEIRGLVN